MAAHLQGHLSIAYYNGTDNTLLGGAEWPVPENPGNTALCLSDLGEDGYYYTICMRAISDNTLPHTHHASYQGSSWCAVQYGQPNLQDGCYTPPSKPNALNTKGTTFEELVEAERLANWSMENSHVDAVMIALVALSLFVLSIS